MLFVTATQSAQGRHLLLRYHDVKHPSCRVPTKLLSYFYFVLLVSLPAVQRSQPSQMLLCAQTFRQIRMGDKTACLTVCPIDRSGDCEGEGQIFETALVLTQEHEIAVQLCVQAGQVIDITASSQQLLEEEGSQGELHNDALHSLTRIQLCVAFQEARSYYR